MNAVLKIAVVGIASLMAIGSSYTASAEVTCRNRTGEAGTFNHTIVSSDLDRTYRLDVPENYDPTQGAGLIFNFHGWGGSGEGQANGTGMPEIAGAEGYITVHADGIGESWNAGTCCGQAALQQVDDVQFVRDMLEEISADYCIDPEAVHSTGFSNGGYFSHRLACQASDIIASIFPVSGVIAVANCEPERPVAMRQNHGTADPLVWHVRGEETFAQWAELNQCEGEPQVFFEDGNVTCLRYANCELDADVEMCSFRGVGHSWVDSRYYSTTEEAVGFFLDHPFVY